MNTVFDFAINEATFLDLPDRLILDNLAGRDEFHHGSDLHALVSARANKRLNCTSVSGATERRDWRTNEISLRSLSDLIVSRLTGVFRGFTGTRSTADQSPSLAVGSR